MNLNLLRQATLEPSRSDWAYFHGPFNYNFKLLGYLGCNIISHKKTVTRNSWDFCGTAGWNLGAALQHYQCHTIVAKSTEAPQVSDKVEFRHHHLTIPDITLDDRIFHRMTTLTCALRDSPVIACNNQLARIQALCQAIRQWAQRTLPLSKVPQVTTHLPNHTQRRSVLRPMHRPETVQPHASLPRVVIQTPNANPSAPNISSTKK